MISLVICSKNSSYLKKLLDNISNTIGCEYEIIFHDNSNNNLSISTVYNNLFQKTNYPYVVFLHEDLEFHTSNWGLLVHNILLNEKVGLLGLSGSVYKSKYPGVWSASLKEFYRISNCSNEYILNKQIFDKVAVVDGCFMATRKDVFEDYSFDEKLVGFHGYDIDLSLNIAQRYEVVVAKGIDFTHYSEGVQSLNWLESSFYVHKKWQKRLPSIVVNISKEKIETCDYLAAQNVYKAIYELKYSGALVIKYNLIFVLKYFKKNRLKYSKKTIKYFSHSIKTLLHS